MRTSTRASNRSFRLVAACLVLGLATFAVAVFPAQVASAATDIVTNCNSSGPGSLPDVIGSAASGDTITFSASCPPGSPIMLSSSIDISGMTIDGPGVSTVAISGGSTVRVFQIDHGTTATVSGVTVMGGNAPNGGGIFNKGTLTVTNSTLSGNSAAYDGGGIYSQGGSLTVANSTVSDNTAPGGGGGIWNLGSLTVSNSTVSGNSVTAYNGGGIENRDGLAATITDSTLSGNSAHLNGGGIYNYESSLSVTDSTLSGNSASNGGGVYNDDRGGGPLTVTNSTISGNSASNGGGIGNEGRSAVVVATVIANSMSGKDCHGRMTDGGYNLDDDRSCRFMASTDLSNIPAGLDPAGLQSNGGPTQTIALEPGSPALGAVNSASLCSTPDQRGVARPTPCDIGAYQTTTQTVTNCSDSGAGSLRAAVVKGGSIVFALSPPCSTITLDSTIDINSNLTIAGPGLDALAVSGDSAVEDFSVASGITAAISGLTIENGFTDGQGGGISNDGTLTLAGSTLSNNTGSYVGGGIVNHGPLTVTKSSLSGNISGEGGGAIINYGGPVNVIDSTLSENTGEYGGGIQNLGTLTVSDSTLSDNTATQGGGIYNQGGALTVTNSTVSDNSARDDGGGIFINYDSLAITGSTLSGNTASNGAGGGIFNNSGNGTTVSLAATVVANSTPGGDCSGSITDAGYNLDDDGSCGFSAANHSKSGLDPDLGPLQDNGGSTETEAPALGSPVLDAIPPSATGNDNALCSGSDQRGDPRSDSSKCDIGADELESETATARSFFSFTVTTTGKPLPSITETGKLPKHLMFTNNGDGTATIHGTPKKTGVCHFTIRETFGKRMHPVALEFRLAVIQG